jgi:NitT/TauT family transport system ATP-binding protein
MQQRVSIARALAVNPDVLLMDEPFGALDAQTRNYMQEELLKIWQREPKTVVFVTHSIDEAVRLSDRIMIMSARPGRVQEIKQVVFPRPRDPRDPGVAQLVVEIWDWLRPRVAEEEQASRIGPA